MSARHATSIVLLTGVIAAVLPLAAGDAAAAPATPLTSPLASAAATVLPDSIAPVSLTVSKPASGIQNTRTTSVAWSATDADSGVASYDVRVRSWSYRTSPSPSFTTWKSKTTLKSGTYIAKAGYTHCFSVRARDALGNLSPYSVEKCTAAPVDDTSMTSSRFTRSNSASYYGGETLRSTTKGATASLSSVHTTGLWLVATTCRSCGTVDVYLGSAKLRALNLRSSTTKHKQLVQIGAFSTTRTGTLKAVVTSSGKPVYIEGVGVKAATVSGSVSFSGKTLTTSRTVTVGLKSNKPIGQATARVAPGSGVTALASKPFTAFTATRSLTLPSGDGPQTVVAQYKDSAGNLSLIASGSITLDTTAPSVTNVTGNTSAPEQGQITVSAKMTDANRIGLARLYYRATGTSDFATADMTAAGDVYSVTLSGATLAQPLEYYVEATDRAGLKKRNPSSSLFTIALTAPLAIPTIARTSPAAGESAVAVTREIIIDLSAPVDPASVLDGGVALRGLGANVPATAHVAFDKRRVTLFPSDQLPPNTNLTVTVDGDSISSPTGNLDADGDGKAGGKKSISFSTLGYTTIPGTKACGRVFASQVGDGGASAPLASVSVTVEGMSDELRTTSDATGNFCLDPAPAGEFFALIDGRTTTSPVPVGAYYPFVGKPWKAVPGETTAVGDVFLPLVAAGTLMPASATENTAVNFPASVLAANPSFAGTNLTVPPDTLFSDDGGRGGKVGIAPVAPDRLPGPLPPGASPGLVITVQTDGPSNFDRPVPACFPNLPVEGAILAPGAKSALWSYDHDEGQWVPGGPATVSADGTKVCTDPGYGIREPSWHFFWPWWILQQLLDKLGVPKDPCAGGQAFADGYYRAVSKQPSYQDFQQDPLGTIWNTFNANMQGFGSELVDSVSKSTTMPKPVQDAVNAGFQAADDVVSLFHNAVAQGNTEYKAQNTLSDQIIDNWHTNVYAKEAAAGLTQGEKNLLNVGVDGAYYLYKAARTAQDFFVGGAFDVTEDISGVANMVTGIAVNEIELGGNASLPVKTLANMAAYAQTPEGQAATLEMAKDYLQFGVKQVAKDENLISKQSAVKVAADTTLLVAAVDKAAQDPDKANAIALVQSGLGVLKSYAEKTGKEGLLDKIDEFEKGNKLLKPTSTLKAVVAGAKPFTKFYDSYNRDTGGGKKVPLPPGAVPCNPTPAPAASDPELADAMGAVDAYNRAEAEFTGAVNDVVEIAAKGVAASGFDAGLLALLAAARSPLAARADAFKAAAEGAAPVIDAIAAAQQALQSDFDPMTIDDPSAYKTIYCEWGTETGSEFRGPVSGAISEIFLPPDREIRYRVYDGPTNSAGGVMYAPGTTGERRNGALTLRPLAADAPDADNDGAPDVAEDIVGTNPNDNDTDNDGIKDGAELKAGTDPLDGVPVRTGIVATVDTPGTAVGVDAADNLVAVADSERGVSLFNVFGGLTPTLVARVDTDGSAADVALAGDRIAVADGASGLAIVNIANVAAVPAPVVLDLGAPVTRVATQGSLAYAVAGNEIVVVDLPTATELVRYLVPDAVDDVAVAGGRVVVITDGKLYVYDDFRRGSAPRGNVAIGGSAGSGTVQRRIAAGGNLAWVGIPLTPQSGYKVVNLANPDAPAVVGNSAANQLPVTALAPTGSGPIVVGERGGPPVNQDVAVADGSVPSDVTKFGALIPTPGVATAVALFNGFAYVADGAAGLQVVNYKAFDSGSTLPTVALTGPNTAEEGQQYTIGADVADDVQVARVEFFVDGTRILTDGAFPFEATVVAPKLTQQATFVVKARAYDTGGNVRVTSDRVITVVPDATPPSVRSTLPGANRKVLPGTVQTVFVTLSEGVNPASFGANPMTIVEAGPDAAPGTGDDIPVSGQFAYAPDFNTLSFTAPAPLAAGRYRVTLAGTIADIAGNAMGTKIIDFRAAREVLAPPGSSVQFTGDVTGRQTDTYEITVATPQRVIFDALSGGPTEVKYTLFGPSGSTMIPETSFADGAPVNLPGAGTYRLRFRGVGIGVGTYDARLWTVPAAQTFALTKGQPAAALGGGAANLETPGAVDRFTFTGAAGETVLVDAGGGFQNMLVTGPQNATILPSQFLGDTRLTLPAAGTYWIEVTGTVGAFDLTVWTVPPPQTFALTKGQPVVTAGANDLESPGAIDRYTFAGAAGEALIITGGGTFKTMMLEGPQDATIFPATSLVGKGPIVLPAAGAYTLEISGTVGTYTLQVATVPAPQTFALTKGQPVSGLGAGAANIESPGARDRYTFGAVAGETVELIGTGSFLNVSLAGPDGTVPLPNGGGIFQTAPVGIAGTMVVTVAKAGSYTVTVDGGTGNTGAYTLTVLNPGVPQDFTIAIGQAVSNGVPGAGAGNLETADASDRYAFTGSAGQVVKIVGTSCRAAALRGPGGALVSTGEGLCRNAPVRLPSAGTYTLTVAGAAGTYSFTVTALSAPQSFAIAAGQTVANGVPAAGAGNIEANGAVDVYTFSATSGDRLFLDITNGTTTFAGSLYGPDGSLVQPYLWLFDEPIKVAPVSGTYTFVVKATDDTATGTYGFMLRTVPAAQPFTIATGQAVTNGVPAAGAGNIEVPGAVDTYTFALTAGQTFFVDASSGSGFDLRRSLSGPNGWVFEDNAIWSDSAAFVVPASGNYTMTVSAATLGTTSTYGFAVRVVPNAESFAIAPGQAVTNGAPTAGAGNLEAPGAVDSYTVSLTAGQRIFVDTTAGSGFDLRRTITGPNGWVVENNAIWGDSPVFVAPVSGTYTVRVAAESLDKAPTYGFVVRIVPAEQAFNTGIGQTVSNGVPVAGAGNLEAPGAVDTYAVSLTAGQKVFVDVTSGSGFDIRRSLTGPNGWIVEHNAIWADSAAFVVPTTGTYVVRVAGESLDKTATYGFAVALSP